MSENDYDLPSVHVITMMQSNDGKQSWHGTLLPPEGMNPDEARRAVLKCIKAAVDQNKTGWKWSDVHLRLANFGFRRINQTFVYEHEINHTWAVMAARQKGDAKLFAVVATPHEAETICSDLKAQGWKVAYKQPSELMVNHVAPGSLHKEN